MVFTWTLKLGPPGVEGERMPAESCRICGGDGIIGNSFGLTTKCPGCHGSGRRSNEEALFHDVTKTKPSHHRQPNKEVVVPKQTWPASHAGAQLANEIQGSPNCSKDTMAKLIREVIDHELSHGTCTQAFIKKVRKQIRPLT